MAYTASVSSPMKDAERISRSLGIYAGTVNISSYNTTLVKITGITKFFVTGGVAGFTQGILAVVPTGISDSGFELRWNYATGAFNAYRPTNVDIPVDSNVGAGAALLFASGGGTGALHATSAVGDVVLTASAQEAANDDNIGKCGFIAIGFVR